MSVFALASRYTNDARVLLDEPVETPLEENAEHSQWQTAGFKYYFPILGKPVCSLSRRSQRLSDTQK
jgi:hypothetical protein